MVFSINNLLKYISFIEVSNSYALKTTNTESFTEDLNVSGLITGRGNMLMFIKFLNGDCSEENQEHLLNCKTLLGKSEILTYIPSYSELFCDDLEAQVYVARLLQDNYSRRIV